MDSKSEKGRKNKGDKAKKQKKSNHGKAAANAKSSDLTKWMEKNGVFDEQLHSVLISQHISTLQQLVCLKEDKFEKIATVAKHWGEKLGFEGKDILNLLIAIDVVNDLHDLRLDDMLAGLDSHHVAHDVAGIWNNLDRKSKTLMHSWTPRFGRQ